MKLFQNTHRMLVHNYCHWYCILWRNNYLLIAKDSLKAMNIIHTSRLKQVTFSIWLSETWYYFHSVVSSTQLSIWLSETWNYFQSAVSSIQLSIWLSETCITISPAPSSVYGYRKHGTITKVSSSAHLNPAFSIWLSETRHYYQSAVFSTSEPSKEIEVKKWSSSGRTELAIHFQPGWPTTSECFSYSYTVS